MRYEPSDTMVTLSLIWNASVRREILTVEVTSNDSLTQPHRETQEPSKEARHWACAHHSGLLFSRGLPCAPL